MYPSDIFSRMYAGDEGNKLYPKQEQTPSEIDDALQTNLFNVMLNRRSQRKFENKEVEDWKLELIAIPVSDVDRAKSFYLDNLGFELLVDHSPSDAFRIVQMVPRGSVKIVA